MDVHGSGKFQAILSLAYLVWENIEITKVNDDENEILEMKILKKTINLSLGQGGWCFRRDGYGSDHGIGVIKSLFCILFYGGHLIEHKICPETQNESTVRLLFIYIYFSLHICSGRISVGWINK